MVDVVSNLNDNLKPYKEVTDNRIEVKSSLLAFFINVDLFIFSLNLWFRTIIDIYDIILIFIDISTRFNCQNLNFKDKPNITSNYNYIFSGYRQLFLAFLMTGKDKSILLMEYLTSENQECVYHSKPFMVLKLLVYFLHLLY